MAVANGIPPGITSLALESCGTGGVDGCCVVVAPRSFPKGLVEIMTPRRRAVVIVITTRTSTTGSDESLCTFDCCFVCGIRKNLDR